MREQGYMVFHVLSDFSFTPVDSSEPTDRR
jgi:hypothetical protein